MTERKENRSDDGFGCLLLVGGGVVSAIIGVGALIDLSANSKDSRQGYQITRGSENNSLLLDFNSLAWDSTINSAMKEVLNNCEVLGTVQLEGRDVLVIVKDQTCQQLGERKGLQNGGYR